MFRIPGGFAFLLETHRGKDNNFLEIRKEQNLRIFSEKMAGVRAVGFGHVKNLNQSAILRLHLCFWSLPPCKRRSGTGGDNFVRRFFDSRLQ
jgi:hypothetical protein